MGKDFSKLALPVVFNEPLSALQRWAEELEYAVLLDRASELADPHVSNFLDRNKKQTNHNISGFIPGASRVCGSLSLLTLCECHVSSEQAL